MHKTYRLSAQPGFRYEENGGGVALVFISCLWPSKQWIPRFSLVEVLEHQCLEKREQGYFSTAAFEHL